MRKDPTEFRERFLRWKKGEQVYENGLALPAYEDGKDVNDVPSYTPSIDDREQPGYRKYLWELSKARRNAFLKEYGDAAPIKNYYEDFLSNSGGTFNYRRWYNLASPAERKYGLEKGLAHWRDADGKTSLHPSFSIESPYSGYKNPYNPKGITGGKWIDDDHYEFSDSQINNDWPINKTLDEFDWSRKEEGSNTYGYYKGGVMLHEPTIIGKMPKYEDGKSPRKLEYHPEGDYYYGGKVFPDKELVVTGHRKGMARKLYSRPWKTYGDLSRESNEKTLAEIASLGGLERYAIHRDLSKPLSPVDPVGELIVGNAVLGPAFNYVGKGLKSVGNTIVDDALIQAGKSGSKWAKAKAVLRAMRNPIISTDAHTISPIIRTKVGDVEIDNPGLYYHQSDAGKAKNFISTGRMRTPIEESWLAKEEAGEKIPLSIRSGVKPGYPQSPGMAMFAQGHLWYGLTPKKPDLLVTAREMPIANKNASVMSNRASLRALEMQGPRRVTNDNIYDQGPHNRQNTTAYTWEPGYGYRRVFAEETPTAEWPISRTAPRITTENAASITPAQWTAAQDAAIARGDMAEAQRLRDLHFKVSAPNTKYITEDGLPKVATHGTNKQFNSFKLEGPDIVHRDPGDFGYGHYFYPWNGKSSYGDRQIRAYLNMERPYTGDWSRNFNRTAYDEKRMLFDMIQARSYGLTDMTTGQMFDEINKLRTADGVIAVSPYSKKPLEVVIPRGEQIKSADAVTYDNNGVRIPLGKRDNFKLNDIRYGLLPVIGATGYGMYKSK